LIFINPLGVLYGRSKVLLAHSGSENPSLRSTGEVPKSLAMAEKYELLSPDTPNSSMAKRKSRFNNILDPKALNLRLLKSSDIPFRIAGIGSFPRLSANFCIVSSQAQAKQAYRSP
jgi:hypothetical protein